MPGWHTPTRGITNFADLPDAAKRYVARIVQLTGVPVGILSLGPGRESTLLLGAQPA